MTFRPIGIVLADVIGRLEMQAGCGCSDERAPTPAHPDTRGTEFVATGHERERTQPVAFAHRGEEETRAQTGMGKKAGSRKAPRQLGGQEEHTQTRTSRDWQAISASLFTANRNKVTGCPTARPTRPVALFLVVDNGHAAAPKALRAFRISKATPTSVIPAMKP